MVRIAYTSHVRLSFLRFASDNFDKRLRYLLDIFKLVRWVIERVTTAVNLAIFHGESQL